MQKDIASMVSEQLTKPDSIQHLIALIKSQANEIEKRGNIIMDLEDRNEIFKKNVLIIAASNKQLENMIENLKDERLKLLEEIEDLKNKPTLKQEKVTKKKSAKQTQVVLGQ